MIEHGQSRPPLETRSYQTRIVNKTLAMFLGTYRNGAGETEPPARSVMIESPTGSGKSVMGLLVAKTLHDLAEAKVGWVAMRRNLLDQVQRENERHGINVPLRTISMFEKNPPTDIDLLVIDEGQHDAANSCAHLHNVIKPKWILGLSATPFRTDRVKLCFDRVIKDCGIHQLIQDNYLSQYDHYTIPRWDAESLADFYCREPERWGKSLFFFQTVADCFTFHRLLQRQGLGIAAVGIHDEWLAARQKIDHASRSFAPAHTAAGVVRFCGEGECETAQAGCGCDCEERECSF